MNYLFDLFKKSKDKDDFYNTELVPLFFKTLNNVIQKRQQKRICVSHI
jgi:hypothetical protein